MCIFLIPKSKITKKITYIHYLFLYFGFKVLPIITMTYMIKGNYITKGNGLLTSYQNNTPKQNLPKQKGKEEKDLDYKIHKYIINCLK